MNINESNFLDFWQQFDILYTKYVDTVGDISGPAQDDMIALYNKLDEHAAYLIDLDSMSDDEKYDAEIIQLKPIQVTI